MTDEIRPGPASERTKVRRHSERGHYDTEALYAVLEEGIIAHVGVVTEHGPVVLPMAYGRVDDDLYLHGAAANALLRAAGGVPVCVTVTLLDGLVLARSAFHHSMNFRSAVIYGAGRTVSEPDEQRRALDAIVDHNLQGRSTQVRPPTDSELRATRVIRVPLGEASVKVRTGGPIEDETDLTWPVWAGVVPLAITRGEPLEDVRA